jgi:hypothetical protein
MHGSNSGVSQDSVPLKIWTNAPNTHLDNLTILPSRLKGCNIQVKHKEFNDKREIYIYHQIHDNIRGLGASKNLDKYSS